MVYPDGFIGSAQYLHCLHSLLAKEEAETHYERLERIRREALLAQQDLELAAQRRQAKQVHVSVFPLSSSFYRATYRQVFLFSCRYTLEPATQRGQPMYSGKAILSLTYMLLSCGCTGACNTARPTQAFLWCQHRHLTVPSLLTGEGMQPYIWESV